MGRDYLPGGEEIGRISRGCDGFYVFGLRRESFLETYARKRLFQLALSVLRFGVFRKEAFVGSAQLAKLQMDTDYFF